MSEYVYVDSEACHTEAYLWQPVLREIENLKTNRALRVLDLGCGNGSFSGALHAQGHEVIGIDPSQSGIEHAQAGYPEIDFRVMSAYDPLELSLGQFDVVVSLEVVEHLYSPREFARNLFHVLQPGGTAIISTPFHGYFKNLSLAIAGKLDAHFTALWDHGHIKFWSTKSLSKLLTEAGFVDVSYKYAGRWYPFSKSMIAITKRPS